MKRIFTVLLILCICLSGCGQAPAKTMDLKDVPCQDITAIHLTNCHNGKVTVIRDSEDIARILAFLQSFRGNGGHSGKGYYEGSYALALFQGQEQAFSMAFGDSDCFFCGKGEDGYPVRYLLEPGSVDSVIAFFSVFDESL